MKLELYRLSLSERGHPTLFAESDPRFGPRASRTDFLTTWMVTDREFKGHGGARLRFSVAQIDRHIISGAFGRWMVKEQETDPTNLWAVTESMHWEKASVFINLNPHDQVIAIEHKPKVGKPSSIVKYFVSEINEKSSTPGYGIDVFPITDKLSFYEAIAKFRGPITSVTFDLVIPNPTDAAGKTAKALKKLKKYVKADRYRATPSSKEGLNVGADIVKDASEYAALGGGDVIARSEKKVVYDSRKHVRTIDVPEELRPTGEPVSGLREALSSKLER